MYIQFWGNDPFFSALPGIAKTILTTTFRYKGTLFKARIKSGMKLETGTRSMHWTTGDTCLQSQAGNSHQIPYHLFLPSPSKFTHKVSTLGRRGWGVCALAKEDKGHGGALWKLCKCQAPQDRAHVPTALQEFLLWPGEGCRKGQEPTHPTPG